MHSVLEAFKTGNDFPGTSELNYPKLMIFLIFNFILFVYARDRFESENERDKKRRRKREPIWWFILLIPTMAGAGRG